MTEPSKFRPNSKQWRVYRPNKTQNGVAFSLQFTVKQNGPMLFLVGAGQTGVDANNNASFDWQKGITVKIDEVDAAEMLAVLTGRQDSIRGDKGLFHQTKDANKIVKLAYRNDTNAFDLGMSDNSGGKYFCRLSVAEAEVLTVLLREFIRLLYNWQVIN
ncbi:MAG: hypothetical protein WC942_08625 [Clostridia bacterium]|jgi:hypothetical protein